MYLNSQSLDFLFSDNESIEFDDSYIVLEFSLDQGINLLSSQQQLDPYMGFPQHPL